MITLFRGKLPYTQEELSEYIGDLANLTKLREKAQAMAVVHQNDSRQQKFREQTDRYDENIKTAQLALQHMLEKNVKWLKGK